MCANYRKCIGCGKIFERGTMFRILKRYNDGRIILAPSNKDFGKSVYICKNNECLKNAFKKGKINHFTKLKTTDELKLEMEKQLKN